MTSALRMRTELLLERDRATSASVRNAAVPVSEITPGTEMFDILTGGYGLGGAGVAVTERSAMCVSAVYASVALIGGAIASLPFHIYKQTGDTRERLSVPLWSLFNRSPLSNWTAASAWQFAAQSIALKGDGYWEILRAGKGSAISGFKPWHPDRVQGIRDPAGTGNIYNVTTEAGTIRTVLAEDMLHFPGIGFDGIRSITPIGAALRGPTGIALAADEYAGGFFRNGARADFALATDGNLKQDQVEILRNTWASRHQGPGNAHLPAVLTGGMKIQQLTMTAEDAQLLSTRKFQVEDIARIFGVPPHMIGFTEKTTSWGTGVEQMSIGFVRYTLRRYIDAIQQEINRKVFPSTGEVFGEFNTDALMDGDSKAQAEYFAKALGGPGTQGWMTINEVRKLKNLKPVPGGEALIFASTGTATATPDPEADQ